MVLVIGNSHEKIELKDLKDCIYWKQQKVYTDDQFERSPDLQRAWKKGSISILKKADDHVGSFNISTSSVSSSSPVSPPAVSAPDERITDLLDRIKGLEKSLSEKQAAPVAGDTESIKILIEKISSLESKLSGDRSTDVTPLLKAVENLEKKVDSSSISGLIDRIESALSRSPGEVKKEEFVGRPDEVYVPNVSVEDANSHVKLNVRKIESTDSVSESLRKLKELKSKSI